MFHTEVRILTFDCQNNNPEAPAAYAMKSDRMCYPSSVVVYMVPCWHSDSASAVQSTSCRINVVHSQRRVEVNVVHSQRRVQSTSCTVNVVYSQRRVESTSCTVNVVHSQRRIQSTSCRINVVHSQRRIQSTSYTINVVHSQRRIQSTSCIINVVHSQRRAQSTSCTVDVSLYSQRRESPLYDLYIWRIYFGTKLWLCNGIMENQNYQLTK